MTAIPFSPALLKKPSKRKKRLVASASNLSVEERAKILYREARELICGGNVSDAFAQGAMFVCATALMTLEHNWRIADGRSPDEVRQMFEWALTDAGVVAEEISRLIREDKSKAKDGDEQ